MSNEYKYNRLGLQQQILSEEMLKQQDTLQTAKYSPLMMTMRFDQHDASQVDKWLILEPEAEFDAAFDTDIWQVH